MIKKDPKHGDLRVWWIPQFPLEPFLVDVKSVDEAKLLLRTLADYDLFQLEKKIKPDYSNAGGLWEFDGDENVWEEWESKEDGCWGQTIEDEMDIEDEIAAMDDHYRGL